MLINLFIISCAVAAYLLCDDETKNDEPINKYDQMIIDKFNTFKKGWVLY